MADGGSSASAYETEPRGFVTEAMQEDNINVSSLGLYTQVRFLTWYRSSYHFCFQSNFSFVGFVVKPYTVAILSLLVELTHVCCFLQNTS